MDSPKWRLAHFLSDLAISSAEFEELVRWMESGGMAKSIMLARRLRKQLTSLVGSTKPPKSIRHSDPAEGGSEYTDEQDRVYGAFVDRLARERSMPRKKAAAMVAHQLGMESSQFLSQPSRVSIAELVEMFGGSRVLSAILQLHNEAARRKGSDWPLKGEGIDP